MIDEEKIKLMTKLAIYEKNYGTEDKKINKYYKSDYIYIKNWWTRISVLIVSLLIVGLILFHKMFVEKIDIFSIDYKTYGIGLGSIIIVLLIFYSILSKSIYEKKYMEAEKRIKRYLNILNQLEEHAPLKKQEEVKRKTYESNLSNKRNDDWLL
ncbi:hypothetical protein [Defluviitalea phaphyphila]|uniref:hypothetical protein n=1 Tax=Defluviitalea phaphyphila TaxID=1473580 RepID=UPI00073088B4|nr:hypothetical protein [Defluviitalea phaphyphila]